MKKIIFILVLFLSCYLIYNLTTDSKIFYLTLGDGLSYGVNTYGIREYGYSSYVRDYLEDSNRLSGYNDSFTGVDYRITDILRMIEYNDTKLIDGKEVNLSQLISEADIITLSVGMNELYYKISDDNANIYNYMNELILDMKELLKHINRFNHKKVFVLGYYNVGVSQEKINYINAKLKDIVNNEGFVYIDLSNIFDNNPRYFTNNGSFIPKKEGYLKISEIIIENLKNY